ncbi:hypothetical protein HAX54_028080 [Datura stramonium]|uniref:Uncharacterized protein n=1 Tax=Datura stramonium TaxID=4076 RepID=A0ABS8V5J1_DATST|nr:hypothetical protein [Datura stramonium]
MEGGAATAGVSIDKQNKTTPSYTYWVRGNDPDAAPLPVPELTGTSLINPTNHLPILDPSGIGSFLVAEVAEVTRCSGDVSALNLLNGQHFAVSAFLVTVRNKKRVGYTYELTIKVKGNVACGAEKEDSQGPYRYTESSRSAS